ncbi:MAG TPA: hypothetical protein VNG13_01510 [Mycobacteriales bacterium]|nr:hypothetical protein [Mycobacteriales bacterium]
MNHGRLVIAGALLTVSTALVPLGGSAQAGSGCLATSAPRGTWSLVPAPAAGAAIGQLGDDPCRLIAVTGAQVVETSSDGGSSWQPTGARTPAPIGQIVTGGLPAETALFLPLAPSSSPAGLFRTTDGGRTVSAVAGLNGLSVLSITAGAGGSVYVAVSGTPATRIGGLPCTANVCGSTDGGASFAGITGPAGVTPDSVSLVPGSSQNLWLDDTSAPGGVFQSSNGGQTATPVGASSGWTVHQVLATPARGGGTELLVATAHGLEATVDGGQTFSQSLPLLDLASIAVEAQHPSALMAITGSQVVRTANLGQVTHSASQGLPSYCGPTDLRGDSEVPTTFLLTCGAGGATYRYRSDGTDLEGTPRAASGPPDSVPVAGSDIAMQALVALALPAGYDSLHSSIAFDGQRLIYTTENDQEGAPDGFLHAMDTRGHPLPDLRTTIPHVLLGVTYDSLRDLLYVTDATGGVWSVDPRTGRSTPMFASPVFARTALNRADHGDAGTGDLSYDPEIDRFRAIVDAGRHVYELTRTGQVTGSCLLPTSILSAANLNDLQAQATNNNTADNNRYKAAAVVATGNGDAYVEMEDDVTVIHIDRSCHLLAVFHHHRYAEASMENDELACDTVSFAKPVVWIRDADLHVVTAYEVPSGYCALATGLRVARSGATEACVALDLAGSGQPIPNQPVQLFRDRRLVATATTGPLGSGCASVPSSSSAELLGVFLGTPAYRPAWALAPPAAPRAPVGLFPPHLGAPPGAGPLVGSATVPVVTAPIVPVSGPVPAQPPQAIQPQPGVQPQLNTVAQRESEPAAADSTGDQSTHEYTALADPHPAPLLPLELGAAALLGLAVELRRRASRVRAQRG